MNSPASGTRSIGGNDGSETRTGDGPDEHSLLLGALEVTRRELARANRQIAMLLREQKRSQATIRRLEMMATTDVLTDLVNRRRFDQVLDTDFALAVMRAEPLSVIMVDVDDFKSYNDTFGHSAGDVVLYAFARHLVKLARPTDVVARYGGDEFAILLREADADFAQSCAERYRDSITSVHWPKRPVTASLGVATRTPSIGDPASLVDEADRALYDSKRGGRQLAVNPGAGGASANSTRMTQETSPARIWTPRLDRGRPLEGEAVERPNFRGGS